MASERHHLNTNMINNWIVELQGTGRFDLNAIVNDLIVLRQMIYNDAKFDKGVLGGLLRQLLKRVNRLLAAPQGLMPKQIDALNDIVYHVSAISQKS